MVNVVHVLFLVMKENIWCHRLRDAIEMWYLLFLIALLSVRNQKKKNLCEFPSDLCGHLLMAQVTHGGLWWFMVVAVGTGFHYGDFPGGPMAKIPM